jgi:hypothetical protein
MFATAMTFDWNNAAEKNKAYASCLAMVGEIMIGNLMRARIVQLEYLKIS